MIEPRHGRGTFLSFLAPAAAGVLPALLLGFLPGARDESYDLSQHLMAGLTFGIVFGITFLFGGWRRHWAASLGGLCAIVGVAASIVWQGLPGFHAAFVLAGAMVGGGYAFSQRRESGMILEAAMVALCSTLGFWALSRLSWWVPFDQTLAVGSNCLWFLAITAAVVGGLCLWQGARDETRPGRTFRLLDAGVLVLLAVAVARTTNLVDNLIAIHHWSVYVGSATMVQEGRMLLGQVPSQYGFLSILVLAGLPAANCYAALYWMQVIAQWVSGAILYYVLRAWLPVWWWQLGAGLITVVGVAFFCGDLAELSGPMLFPSAGAVRFICVYVLIGLLVWWHRTPAPRANPRRFLWVGSGFWLIGVLWSVESAIYVTAIWLPAVSLLAMPAEAGGFPLLRRLRALAAGVGVCLLIVGLYLAAAWVVIEACYRLIYHQSPHWPAYWEYAGAFAGGFFALPIEPQGPVWGLLLLHTALLAALVGAGQRRQLVLVWAAWGACWSASTYYIARSHPNNISNLGPVLLLVIGTLVEAVKGGDRRGLVWPWIWIAVPTWVGAVLWLPATNFSAVKKQLATYQVTSRVDRLLPAQAEAGQLLAQCQRAQPGPFSMVGFNDFVGVPLELTTPHPNWLPLRSLPLYGPLPLERREYYLDAYHGRPMPGWLLVPRKMENSLFWLLDYVNARYTATSYLRSDNWQAWYYVPKARREPRKPGDQPTSGGYHPPASDMDENLRFYREFGGDVDVRFLTTSAIFHGPSEGRGIIGVTTGSAEMRLGFSSNRVQSEMMLRREDGDAGGVLAADFVAYAGPVERPEVRFERWRGRIELPADKKEISVLQEIDGSGMSALFTVEIPKEFTGRMIAGWRGPYVNHVSRDSSGPAWLFATHESAVLMNEAALARLLPDNWRPVEAWMRGACVSQLGIELSPGGEIWLKVRDSFARFSGTSVALAPVKPGRQTAVRGLWYKGGRMHWYDMPWPKDPPVDTMPFHAIGAEPGGWLVIAADPDFLRGSALVRVTEVTEAK